MRRFLSAASVRRPYLRGASYAAGLFHFKVVPEELFPFPSYRLGDEEGENLVTLTGQVSKAAEDASASTATPAGLINGSRIAVEYGGLGLGHTAFALVCEELGRSGIESLLSTMQTASLAANFIAACGTKEQKGKYLTTMSDGTEVVGWAVQEAHLGADVSMNRTTARLENDGSRFVLSGTKVCRDADKATHFLVLAKTRTQIQTDDGPQEAERNTMFIVDRNAKGVTIKSSDELVLEDVKADDVISTVGEGFRNQLITVLTEQYTYAATLLGILKACCQEAVGDRNAESGGVMVSDLFASCGCAIYAMESALYAVAGNLDRQTEDILIESCFAATFIQQMARQCMASLSAVAPIAPRYHTSLHMMLNRMEHIDYLHGAGVSCGVEEYGLAFQATSTLAMMQRRTLRMFGIKERLPVGREIDCSLIDSAIVNFGNAVETTFVRNTTSTAHQQMLLNRLGEAGALLFAASAAASRAAMAVQKGLPTARTEKHLASVVIQDATRRANALCDECRNTGMTADDISKRIALELCDDVVRRLMI